MNVEKFFEGVELELNEKNSQTFEVWKNLHSKIFFKNLSNRHPHTIFIKKNV